MSSESTLDSSEDLENVPLVRMEDIQPIDRSSDSLSQEEEILETCIIDDAIYEECVVDDDDSNIGSMVSIQSEEVVECDDETEYIGPDSLQTEDIEIEIEQVKPKTHQTESKPNWPESWPTLEILPGGVINLADKNDQPNLYPNAIDQDTAAESGDMIYACAKCSQSFKYLFCLVKHVRWHEEEAKKVKKTELVKMTPIERKLADLKRRGQEMDKIYKKQNVQVLKSILKNRKKD